MKWAKAKMKATALPLSQTGARDMDPTSAESVSGQGAIPHPENCHEQAHILDVSSRSVAGSISAQRSRQRTSGFL
jgi:hypothetical protein